ncbi:MAG TPA: hypothetical protein VIQ51_14600 [Chryseosolibacter sp.]
MKSWGTYLIFLTTLIILLAAGSVLAQEAGMSDVEVVNDREASESEKSVFVPGEDARYIPRVSNVSPAKDSIMLQMYDFPMQRAAQRPVEKPAEKQPAKAKDDSILTFNFLYYIIQKYKLQDIID